MKPSAIIAIGIVLSYAALAHEGHEHATGVVRERMELMTDMGKRLLAISKRLRNNKELDHIAPDARAIKERQARSRRNFLPEARNSRLRPNRSFGSNGTISLRRPKN